MATEFKLSYTGSQINEKLSKIDSLATTDYVDTKFSGAMDAATVQNMIDAAIAAIPVYNGEVV